jgi:hypothetical protein
LPARILEDAQQFLLLRVDADHPAVPRRGGCGPVR